MVVDLALAAARCDWLFFRSQRLPSWEQPPSQAPSKPTGSKEADHLQQRPGRNAAVSLASRVPESLSAPIGWCPFSVDAHPGFQRWGWLTQFLVRCESWVDGL